MFAHVALCYFHIFSGDAVKIDGEEILCKNALNSKLEENLTFLIFPRRSKMFLKLKTIPFNVTLFTCLSSLFPNSDALFCKQLAFRDVFFLVASQ